MKRTKCQLCTDTGKTQCDCTFRASRWAHHWGNADTERAGIVQRIGTWLDSRIFGGGEHTKPNMFTRLASI